MAVEQTGKQRGARPNREGKPWRRADGRWCMRVYPPKGTIWARPVYVYGKTRALCIANHDQRRAELASGQVPMPGESDIKIGAYLRRWLYVTLPQYVEAGEMRRSTMDSYQDNAELHIIPEPRRGIPSLASVGLLELSAPMVREWRSGLLTKPSKRQRVRLRPGETELPPPALLSKRTVNYCRSILHKAMQDAIRDEVVTGLTRNVVDLVPPLSDTGGGGKAAHARQVAQRVIPPGQAAALMLEMAEDPLWCYWLVGFAQGFRRGEGLGMRWADVDFAARTWTPALQVQWERGGRDPATGKRGKGRLVAAELKTYASGEVTALTRTAAEALGRWEPQYNRMRLAAPRWADLGLVFTTRFGTALEPRNVNRAWQRLCARAGAPGVRLHDLRHACASYALANGADLKSVQRQLRHSRLDTTQLYLHAVDEVPRAAADAIDTAIEGLLALRTAPEG